ncbi:MAG: Uma2 family endonuclease [Oscillospiraceae bacterium]|nr:Uma2 family endonuclease [Oscillospiraceae bacterium]
MDKLSYSDYYSWDDGKRWELIDGIPYAMAPGPSQEHQSISMGISNQLYNFLKGKTYKVFSAPFDVRLNHDSEDDTVVQPDIIVVCDETKLDGKSCNGAPDMVVEILSPTSERNDRVVKFHLYLRYGVNEYWIVDPVEKTVQTHILENGRYIINVYTETDEIQVHTLEGLTIKLAEVFVG